MIPDGLNYANEKFGSAVYDMARSDAPMRERLHAAYMNFHPVGCFDLPERLRSQFTAIMTRLTAVPSFGDEGWLTRTLLTISDQECRRIAQLIVDLALDIDSEIRCRERNEHHRTSVALSAILYGPLAESMDEWGVSPCEQERSG
jgi:hypothetical protein